MLQYVLSLRRFGLYEKKKEEGQAILELALILPIILIIFCGIIDFGRILYSLNYLNLISQESVRIAGLGQSDTQISTFINNKVILPDKDTITVNITPNDTIRKSGDFVTVKITYKFKYITPLLNVVLPSPLDLKTESTIRVE